ncbi:MAG TPA: cbb3-type cytochrome c oxidase subunit II [Hanamia sp.]|nr:cbb3-type cytochrome c oxidase subunit II [Hanamia sp.]
MEFFNNHKKLFLATISLFLTLTLLMCIIPALYNQDNNAPLPGAEQLTGAALKGKEIYIANGCIACHTQQVRNVDMDKVWGSRPSIASDYAVDRRMGIWRNTATLLGSERTGPDLTNVGERQPSIDWQLLHLYQPRAVVKQSIMPAYQWLFQYKETPGKNDKVVAVPDEFMRGRKGKIVATPQALDLVAYLLSLKQVKLPAGMQPKEFLYKKEVKQAVQGGAAAPAELDGAALYTANCQACHQPTGEGLKGAFPALKGSNIVLSDSAILMVNIIMNGYTGLESQGYGPMPPIGTTNNLSAAEISAIMNHEKTSWGNNAKKVTTDEIQKLMDAVKK